MTKERKRLVTLFVLLGVLALVLVYNRQTADSESGVSSKPSAVQRANGTGAAPSPVKKVTNGASGQSGADGAEGYRPLPLYALKEQGSASNEAKRNIFVYYVPPPPEVGIAQGPPPTIALTGLNPDSVYARTGDFTLRVKGPKFPEDARIFVNGQEQPTQVAGPGELTASVSKSRITSPGKLVVEVKNGRGDFSNTLALNVIEPPAPSYAYVGRIDDLVFLRSGDDRYAVRVGNLVDEKKASRWRVISATDNNLIVQDVMIGLNHRLDMDLGQTASTGNQGQGGPLGNRANRVRQIQPIDEGDDEEFQQQLEQEQLQQIQMQQQLQLQQQQLQMMQQQQLYQQQLQQQQRLQPGQPQQYWPQQQDPQQQQRLIEALQMRQKLLEQQRLNNRRPNRE